MGKTGHKTDLIQLTDRIFYYPHQTETDRPMLAFIKGSKFSLAVDAGYSSGHVDDFYRSLDSHGLKRPDFTVITHWHYDHTFGMHHVHGATIAHEKTNEFLRREKERALNHDYMDIMRREDPCFAAEYAENENLEIVLSDIQFETGLTLNLGGITADIFHTESPHSEDTVCIYIPEEKVLFLGDSTSEDFFNNGYMDSSRLKKLADMIRRTDCRYCILSHTAPLEKEDLSACLDSILHE